MAQQWYVGYPDQVVGPLKPQELLSLAKSGQLTPDTKVSLDRKKWTKAGKIKGLAFPPRPALVPHDPFATTASSLPAAPPPKSPAPEATAIYDGSGHAAPPADEDIRQEIETALRRKDDMIPGYEILDVLGYGAMGVVYRARQKKLDRQVAVKTVLLSQATKASAVARFEQEAVTVAKLQHPHIVAAYDFGQHEGRLFFVMELLQGESLEARLERTGKVPEPLAWNLGRQAAAGLAHAAAQGIIHRDIKPGNLLLVAPPTGFGQPAEVPMAKLTDFGLALLDPGSATSERLTVAGMVVGTPIYMAPEQFRGGTVDHRADIYSLGTTLLHALTGTMPFQGESIWEVMTLKMDVQMPGLANLAGQLSEESLRLLRDMLAVDPAQRLSSYEELMARIDALSFMQGDAPRKNPARVSPTRTDILPQPASPQATARKLSRPALFWAAPVAVALLVIAVGLAWWGLSGPTTKPNYLPGGSSDYLFKGESLVGWVIKTGSWQLAKDSEGTPVISGAGTGSGKGVLRRTVPHPNNFRITFGVDLRQAKSVQVHFGFAQEGDSGPRHVLHIAPNGAVLGRSTADSSELEKTAPTIVPYPAAASDEPHYLTVQLERIENRWWVEFNGKNVGDVAMLQRNEHAEIRLVVDSGPAFFGEVQLFEMKPAPGK